MFLDTKKNGGGPGLIRGAHLGIGLIFFLVYNFINNSLVNVLIIPVLGISPNGVWLIGTGAVALGSVAPDILEPARLWNHRHTFHSRRTLKVILWVFAITALIGVFSALFFYVSAFFLGYLLHLLADSTTKAGLPEK